MNEDAKSLQSQCSMPSPAQHVLPDEPSEPDWALEDDAVLIGLVKDYIREPDLASTALAELSGREHPVVGDLCVFLLAQADADKWLKMWAVRLLPATHLEKGLDVLSGLLHRCDAEMLAVLVNAVNHVLQEDLPEPACNHPVAAKVRALSRHGGEIYFAGRLTRDEFIQAHRLAESSDTPFWKISFTSGGLGLLAGVWSLLRDVEFYIPGLLMFLLGIFWLWFGWKTKDPGLAWDQNPDYGDQYFGTVSEDGIDVYGENFWRFKAWSRLTSWNSSDDMLVVLSPAGAEALPPSLFASSTDWARAQTLCTTKLPPLAKFPLL